MQDRHAEDLGRAEARLLVPRAVERQLGRDLLELGGVVGVGDVDRLLAQRHEAGHRLGADGHPDLPDGVEGQELGVDLLLVVVDRVEGHALGVEGAQQLALDLDEDRVEGLGRVDAVDQLDEPLLVGQLLLKREN